MLVNNVIKNYLYRIAITYLDNILIYSINREKYVKYIREVLEYLSRTRLLLKN